MTKENSIQNRFSQNHYNKKSSFKMNTAQCLHKRKKKQNTYLWEHRFQNSDNWNARLGQMGFWDVKPEHMERKTLSGQHKLFIECLDSILREKKLDWHKVCRNHGVPPWFWQKKYSSELHKNHGKYHFTFVKFTVYSNMDTYLILTHLDIFK